MVMVGEDFINSDSKFGELLKNLRGNLKAEWDEQKKVVEEVKEIFRGQRTLADEVMDAVQKAQKDPSVLDRILDNESDLTKKARALSEIEEQKKIVAEMYANDSKKQSMAMGLIGTEEEKVLGTTSDGWMENTVDGVKKRFSDGLADCVSDFGDFSDGIKSIGDDILKYLVKQSVAAMLDLVMQANIAQAAAKGALGAVKGIGAFLKVGGETVLGSFGIEFPHHHSGGAILPSASGMLPGTQEQIAMLKGGERVLSPSEASSYNEDGFSGGQPVVFLNNNIKAWDAKDVKQYLIDNASLLQSITAQGIRDNKHYLRTMIRNA